jgi:hypothetical protein
MFMKLVLNSLHVRGIFKSGKISGMQLNKYIDYGETRPKFESIKLPRFPFNSHFVCHSIKTINDVLSSFIPDTTSRAPNQFD